MEIIKPQNIKKALKELENKQIEQKKKEKAKRKKAEKAKKAAEKEKAAKMNMQRSAHNKNQNSILALYQSQVYGNNKLQKRIENQSEDVNDENKIKKEFKRFQRLSFMAMNNEEIKKMIDSDNRQRERQSVRKFKAMKEEEVEEESEQEMAAMETQESKEEEEEVDGDIDIDEEAWDSKKEREILELLEEQTNEDENTFNVRLYYPLKAYITEFEYVFNKGLYIKKVDNIGKHGRALILECGVQADKGWFIQSINDQNIKKFSKDIVDKILDALLPDIGYEVIIKQE